MTQVVDRAYANLLGHLQSPSSRLLPQTVLSAIPYYLSSLPLPHPTQLSAFVISSSLWQPPSVDGLWSLANAFRSAIHLKKGKTEKESTGWLSRSPEALLEEWIRSVMKGVSRGDGQLRIAMLGGMLLGLEDFKNESPQHGIRASVESQVVIACAEVLETLAIMQDPWKEEFTVRGSGKREDMNGSVFLYMACQVLPLVASSRLRALDLSAFIQILQKAVKSTFLEGSLLNHLALATTQEPNGQINISSESSLETSLRGVSKNPLFQSAAPLARLLARSLSLLAEERPVDAWHAFNDTFQGLELMLCRVEADWKASMLASVTSEEEIGPQSRELLTEMWSILKTLLFSHVLVSQSILSDVVYMRHPQTIVPKLDHSSIARSALSSLNHLSFIVSRFGGVTHVDGFKELKRTFYMALDIVSADPDPKSGDTFVEKLLLTQEFKLDPKHPFRQAKTAYILAVVEQLVPVLSESILERQVVPFCLPYLDDPYNRDTYESAHSVVLSIFADGAQRINGPISGGTPTFAKRLVPFYVNSLMENSNDGRLSRAQLKLAYSNLVRSAASGGDEALVWLCVEALLSRIEALARYPGRLMDLYLTLVSLISCVPLPLLLQGLEEVEKALEAVDGEDRNTLANAVLEEITNKVGGREKEVALSWWCRVAPRFVVEKEDN